MAVIKSGIVTMRSGEVIKLFPNGRVSVTVSEVAHDPKAPLVRGGSGAAISLGYATSDPKDRTLALHEPGAEPMLVPFDQMLTALMEIAHNSEDTDDASS